MGIQVGDNFDHKSKKPLDARTSYSTLALMKAVTDANIYEGCEAYCVETDKYYKFKSTNTVDETTGKWRERESGGGSGIIKSATLAVGATTVTFTEIPTEGNYIVDFFTSNGVNYTAINTSVSGQVTLTYEAQEVAVTVYCQIRGV